LSHVVVSLPPEPRIYLACVSDRCHTEDPYHSLRTWLLTCVSFLSLPPWLASAYYTPYYHGLAYITTSVGPSYSGSAFHYLLTWGVSESLVWVHHHITARSDPFCRLPAYSCKPFPAQHSLTQTAKSALHPVPLAVPPFIHLPLMLMMLTQPLHYPPKRHTSYLRARCSAYYPPCGPSPTATL